MNSHHIWEIRSSPSLFVLKCFLKLLTIRLASLIAYRSDVEEIVLVRKNEYKMFLLLAQNKKDFKDADYGFFVKGRL